MEKPRGMSKIEIEKELSLITNEVLINAGTNGPALQARIHR